MEIIGLIAEYNPFHNGHLYHINKIKEMYPDSLLVLVLNGYFLQRGEPSIISKYDKTHIALLSGVDIVLELPVLYGTQSADTFSDASIKLLNYFKVKKIIFGSECDDIEKIKLIAKKSIENHNNENIKIHLKNGLNYPTALSKVINEDFSYNSNDLLGICYVKSILTNNYLIDAQTIKRTNDYLDKESNDDIISALNIREKIKNNIDIKKYLPNYSMDKINKIDTSLLFNLIKIQIINNDISDVLDVDKSMNYLLKKCIKNVSNMDELIKNIKSKKYTYNKINRMLIHILLNIKKSDANLEMEYINILGLSQKGKNYINKTKKEISIPIKKDKKSIIYDYELKSTIIYDMLTGNNEQKKELANKPIII